MTRLNKLTRFLLLCGVTFGLWALSHAQNAQETPSKDVSSLRQFAYGKSGEWLYESLQTIHLPKTRPLRLTERRFTLPVDWNLQTRENKEGFPFSSLRAVDYSLNSKSATAYLAGFKTKYYSNAGNLFDQYENRLKISKHLTSGQKKIILEQDDQMRDRSMVFYLAFKRTQVQFVYYPGKIQFKGGDRDHMEKWLTDVPEDIRKGVRKDYALIQDSHGLLSIFNGTFESIDNFVKWNEPGGARRYGGLGYDFTTLKEPQDEMATFALYKKGRVALGTYKNLPQKEEIRTFVQNRFMVIENGKLAKDADPDAFCEFHDNIARSYLFTDKYNRIGYIWTMYTPANVLAPIALKMGIENMMLLDIHAPVSCSIADPAGPLVFSTWRDYMNRSIDLVPNFFKLSPMKSSITWLSTALQSRIQSHYSKEAFELGSESYFGVFLRGSPEAKRMREIP